MNDTPPPEAPKTLWDFPPIDPSARAKDERRLSGQNAVIYGRLLAGPATNRELAEISLKYTSRISDIRAKLRSSGMTVECDRTDGSLASYRLAPIKETIADATELEPATR